MAWGLTEVLKSSIIVAAVARASVVILPPKVKARLRFANVRQTAESGSVGRSQADPTEKSSDGQSKRFLREAAQI